MTRRKQNSRSYFSAFVKINETLIETWVFKS